jgi:hypothetical protein
LIAAGKLDRPLAATPAQPKNARFAMASGEHGTESPITRRRVRMRIGAPESGVDGGVNRRVVEGDHDIRGPHAAALRVRFGTDLRDDS